LFTFFIGETNASGVPLSCVGVELRDFSMETHRDEISDGWLITFEEKHIHAVFGDLQMSGFYNGMDLPAASRTVIDNVYRSGSGRRTIGGTILRLSSNENAGVWYLDFSTDGAKPADVKLNIEQSALTSKLGNQSHEEGVYIGAADGIYFKPDTRLRGALEQVVLETALAPNRSVIASVDFLDVYFDNVDGNHLVFKGYGNDETLTPPGATRTNQKAKFRSITIDAFRFRSAKATSGINFG